MITVSEWDAYNDGVAEISDAAENEVLRRLLAWHSENPGTTVAEAREYAKGVMGEVVESYDSVASSFAAEWYDYRAETAGARLGQAVTAAAYVPKDADEVARYQAKKLAKGDFEGFARACGEYARNDVLRSLNATIMANAKRDRGKGVRFARVPTGYETCSFCLMLAGRGAVYYSRKTAGEFSHFHRRCDCKVVPCFEDDPMAELVEGRSPVASQRLLEKLAEIDSTTYRDGQKLTGFDVKVLKTAYVNPEIDYDSVLEGVSSYSIHPDKLEKYALDPIRQPEKARAFRGYLGYTKPDAATVAARVYEHAAQNQPTARSTNQYGESETSVMVMRGKSGKRAKVAVGWINEPAAARIRLVTIHVDE